MTSTIWAKVFSRAKLDVWEARYFTKKSARRTRRDAKRALRRGRRRMEREERQGELTGSESLPGR
jgi:hypothetical protein